MSGMADRLSFIQTGCCSGSKREGKTADIEEGRGSKRKCAIVQ